MSQHQIDLFGTTGADPAKPLLLRGRRVAGLVRTVEVIIEAYRAGLFGDRDHEVYPQLDRTSAEWRLYFTLPCALNYQRQSESLWKAALRTYSDPETRFVFDCSNTGRGIESYRKALTKHGLAVQPEKQTHIWYTISSSLWRYFRGDPAILFSAHSSDVRRIKDYIVSSKREFPYLSGPKLLNYWLYIYDYFVHPDITNRNDISVIPDVHIKRASVRLGLVSAADEENTEKVAETWAEFLVSTPYAPCDLHAPLWRWSRAGFPDQGQLEARLSSSVTSRATKITGPFSTILI